MHDSEHATPRPSRFSLSPYIMLWGIAALAAIGYIGWVAMYADRTALRPGAATVGEATNSQGAVVAPQAEIRDLKETVGEVRREIAELRSAVAATAERSLELNNRVAALESGAAAKADPTDTPARPPAATSEAPAAAAPAAPAAKSADAKPAVMPKVLNAPAEEAKALETGSVAASPVAKAIDAPVVFGPAIVKPAPKQVGIQIATGPSLDSLRLSWSLLSDQHPDMLRSLEPRYVSGGPPGTTTFDLVAGPMKSSAEAKRVCAQLESKAVPCKVGTFEGDAL